VLNNYPQDANIELDQTEVLGNGNWDLEAYWDAKHNGDPNTVDAPSALRDVAGSGQQATRYQTYLYELGKAFWVNTEGPGAGKEVIYPTTGEMPAGYAAVTPLSSDVPVAADPANADSPDFDGEPSQQVASDGAARRIVEVAMLKCNTYNVHGEGTYPTEGNYLEIFLTEHVQDPSNATIYGEVVRALSPLNAPEFFSNVQLVE